MYSNFSERPRGVKTNTVKIVIFKTREMYYQYRMFTFCFQDCREYNIPMFGSTLKKINSSEDVTFP